MLTKADVTPLFENPTVDALTSVAAKIATGYRDGEEAQYAMVEDVIRTLISQSAIEVRVALSDILKSCDTLPGDIAFQLSQDISQIACPFLQHSRALDEASLLQLVETSADPDKLRSIAAREVVPEFRAAALARSGDEGVVEQLLTNTGSMIPEETYSQILSQHWANQNMATMIATREDLPPQLFDLVIERVSGPIREHLVQRGEDEATVNKMNVILRQSLDLAFFRLTGGTSANDSQRLRRHFSSDGDFSPFAAICMGYFRLFQVVLARRLQIPPRNARILVLDPSFAGLKAAYQQSQLPESFYDALELCVTAVLEVGKHDGTPPHEIDKVNLVRLQNKMHELARGRRVENLEYFVALMKRHQQET